MWLAVAIVVLALVGGFAILCWLRPHLAARAILWLPARLLYRLRVYRPGPRARRPAGPARLQPRQLHRRLPDHRGPPARSDPLRDLGTRSPACRCCVGCSDWPGSSRSTAPPGRGPSSRRCGPPARPWPGGEPGLHLRRGRHHPHRLPAAVPPRLRADPQEGPRADHPGLPGPLWGSIFSYQGGRFLWKWPQKLPYPVTVAFGKPLPPTAHGGRGAPGHPEAVGRRRRRPAPTSGCPVHRQFVRMAARHPFRPCVIDPTPASKDVQLRQGRWPAPASCAALLRPRPRATHQWSASGCRPTPAGPWPTSPLALLGKTSVNLNYTSSPEVVRTCLEQCAEAAIRPPRPHVARASRTRCRSMPGRRRADLPGRPAQADHDVAAAAGVPGGRAAAGLVPGPVRLGLRGAHARRPGDGHLLQRQHRRPQGGDAHARQPRRQRRVDDPGHRPAAAATALLGILPFFHSFGYTVTLWVPLQVGASIVYHPDPRQAKEIGELCRKHRCTIFLSTPTFLRFCLQRCEPDDFTTLRILMCGAEKLPPPLAEEFQEKFGVLPLEGYGCTELSPAAAANVPDWEQRRRQADRQQAGHDRPAAAGRRRPDRPPGDVRAAAARRGGLLLIYGGNVMEGYLGKPEATRAGRSATAGTSPATWPSTRTASSRITGRLSRFARSAARWCRSRRSRTSCTTILRHDRAGLRGDRRARREARASGWSCCTCRCNGTDVRRSVQAAERQAACRTCGCRASATSSRSPSCRSWAAASWT